MKIRLLLPILGLFLVTTLRSQTIFWSEGFGTGCLGTGTLNTPNGAWSITNTGVNGADANTFVISAQENGHTAGQCGTACSNNDMTLHIYSPVTGDNGAQYLNGGFGVFFPQADQRCESPVINCTGRTSITLQFNYLEFGDGTNDNAQVWWFDGTTWALLQDMPKTTCCGGPCNNSNQGNWGSVSIAMPIAADNNPNVQIGFRWVNNDDNVGTDPSFAVDSVTMSVASSLPPVVSISPSPNDTICQSKTLTLNGSATNGPITAWAWTVSPNAGVAFSPDTAAQSPAITFTAGGTYTFTLAATNSSGTSTMTQTIVVVPSSTPSVTLTASNPNPVCVGTTVGFTATATNAGGSPTYQWQVNGSNVGNNSPNFSSSSLNNNDVITVTVTSSDSCATVATVGDSYTVQTTTSTVPSVTIAASATAACQGTPITFTATPTNGGTTPSYQWMVNNIPAGTNSPNFSSSSLNNNDTIFVILTSSDACAIPATINSDSIIVSITPTVVPSVSLTVNPSGSICAGTTVDFTAAVTNGGTSPVYQWMVNSTAAGTNSPNFSSSTVNNGDTVSVTVTSNAACATPTVVSANYTLQVNPVVVPSVTVLPASVTACAGDSVVFNATTTNGGTTPVFQWIVNGSNVGSNSSSFTLNPVTGGEVVVVQLTSNAVCATPSTATSNTVTVAANPLPTLTVSQNATTVCPNLPDSLFAVSPGASFSWSPAAGLNSTTNDTVVAINSSTGTYTYYVTATLNGCSKKDSITVNVANTFTATAGPAITICAGDSATLSVTGGTTWTWTPAANLSCANCQNPVTHDTLTTTYSVIANQAGCLDTVMQTLTVVPTATAVISYSVVSQGLPQVIAFTNGSSAANTFFWTLGNGNTSVLQTPANQSYPMSGTYTVTMIAYGANNCNDTASVTLLVSDTVGISVPNIFTPNGDEINDVWQPSVHGATSFECTIFNRYGILVYEFLDAQDKWDGHTTSGLACTEGTYFYILKATDKNAKSYNLKGYLQLIR